ncbi:MAG TPA: RsmE family RNA methyltransferase, partial [Bacteroidia bacterium]|nr:RsmE family RNA methyltransferase [Bacteroidia bacterium]
ELKTDRMNKILISALKQSRNGRLPLLHPMTGIRGLMEKKEKAILYICTLQAEQFLGDIYKPGTDALVLIGPEGDFHPSEVEQAIGAGYIPVSLGKSRLRTETAALMACAIIASVNLSSVSKPQI